MWCTSLYVADYSDNGINYINLATELVPYAKNLLPKYPFDDVAAVSNGINIVSGLVGTFQFY